MTAACSPAEPTSSVGSDVAALGADAEEIVDRYVILDGPSAAEAVGPAASSGDPGAIARTRTRLADLEALHDTVRPHLIAVGAQIVGEMTRLANGFHVRVRRGASDKIAALPYVVSVEPVPLFERSLHSSMPVVGAATAWDLGTPLHGEGITLGIMDTGIDYLHADFGSDGNPERFGKDDSTIIEDGTFPTARVAGGHDFCGNEYNPNEGVSEPTPDEDPIDCGGHGTHVAGIAAGGGVLLDGSPYTGSYDMSLDLDDFRVAPGVAPLADLYSLKVFGCDGSTRLVGNALEWAADPNGDGDFSDRLDIINASLGSPYGFPNPTHAVMLDNYHALGGLFVAAAGNEGGTFFITGSPGAFPQALSVAATSDQTFIAFRVDDPPGIAGDYAAAEASFTEPLRDAGDVSGELVRASPALGCDPFDNASEMSGKIAIIDRGDCFFFDKINNAFDAGAIAAVVVNNNFNNPFTMAPPDGGGEVGIPGVMIRLADGDLIKEAIAAGPVTVTLTRNTFAGEGSELMAGFSSRGPGAFDGLVKPEMSAPGAAIESADVGTGFQPTSKQGTSMATPFVAGAAALVRQARPELTPNELKAVLMNSSTRMTDGDGDAYPVSMQGAGRLDVPRAVSQFVTASVGESSGTVAIAFGSLASVEKTSVDKTVFVKNHGDTAVTFSASASQVHALDGVSVTVSPESLTVAPGSTEEVVVTLHLDPFVLGDPARDPITPPTQSSLPRHFLDEADGHLLLTDESDGGQSIVLPFLGIVRAASALSAAGVRGCELEGGEEVVAVTLAGDSAHPEPLVSAFELSGESPIDIASQPKEYDIRAWGVTSDYAITPRFDEVSIHFGIAVEGEWTTPARATSSVVGVAIDKDRDGSIDYQLRVEPLNNEDPYFDVLATRVYDIQNGGTVGSRRYVNLVPANEADTNPFYNSALVLSAFAHDIGLTEEDTSFNYIVFTESSLGTVETTEPVTYDVAAPKLDPTRSAPIPGVPLYRDGEPILTHLGERDGGGLLPELLLLHHNGAPGARFETLHVSNYEIDSFGLTHTFAATIEKGGNPAGKIEIQNLGELPIFGVVLDGQVLGGSATLLAPSHGTCNDGPSINCELGDIPAGATRSITVQIAPNESADALSFDLALRSSNGCEVPFEDTLTLVTKEDQPPAYESGGGCGCSMPGERQSRHAFWVALSLSAFLLRRRKRLG